MPPEHSPDDRWIDHRTAAEQWGISVDSARLKLKRYAWPSRKGNDGKRWYQPPEHYQFAARASGDQPPAIPPADPPALTAALASMAEQLARAHARADGLQQALDEERGKGLWTHLREAWAGRRS